MPLPTSLDALRALTQRASPPPPDAYADPGTTIDDVGGAGSPATDVALSPSTPGAPGGLATLGAPADQFTPRYMVGDQHGVYTMGDTPQGKDAFDTFGAMRPDFEQQEFEKHQALDDTGEATKLAQLQALLRHATQSDDPVGDARLTDAAKNIASAGDVSRFNDPGVTGMRQALSNQKIKEETAVPIVQGQTTMNRTNAEDAIKQYGIDVTAGVSKEKAMLTLLGRLGTGEKSSTPDQFGHYGSVPFGDAMTNAETAAGRFGGAGVAGSGSGGHPGPTPQQDAAMNAYHAAHPGASAVELQAQMRALGIR